jgi:glycosyltransferase involved in cell wall biosynthesis
MKKRILFIQPLFYDPTLPNFKDRFEMLSQFFEGDIISSTDNPKKYDGLYFGNFQYHAQPYVRNKIKRYLHHYWFSINLAIRLSKKKPYDYVHSYDPLARGFLALIIKIFIKAKLITEINGHLKTAGFIKSSSIASKIKKLFINLTSSVVLMNSDIIKPLNKKIEEEWCHTFNKKALVKVFPNFVPTHIFDPNNNKDDNYILFIGHPYYLKGVDILIAAFLKIADLYPTYNLKIIGHCNEKDFDYYLRMGGGNNRIEITNPVFFDKAVELFRHCTFFVLPSRSEAMGRVLVEAMASGKPVIGSRVGGIPEIIEDGINGFLFEPENVNDLADKMAVLLSNKVLRDEMGINSSKIVQDRLSSKHYITNFFKMFEA